MEPKWRRGHDGVGPGAKTSWRLLMAPAALPLGSPAWRHRPAAEPRAQRPPFRSPPWGTPSRTKRQRLEHWPHLRGREGSEETNIWEGSTLLHLQKKAGWSRTALPGSLLAGKTKKASSGGARHPQEGPFPRDRARTPQASDSGDQCNFLLEAGHASSMTVNLGSPDYHFIDVAAPLWLSGFYPETPENLQPASSTHGAPLPRDAPRALSQPAVRTRLAPPSAPGYAAGRTSARGPGRGAPGLAGDPAPSPVPKQRTCKTISIRFLRPSPTGPRPRVPRAG